MSALPSQSPERRDGDGESPKLAAQAATFQHLDEPVMREVLAAPPEEHPKIHPDDAMLGQAIVGGKKDPVAHAIRRPDCSRR